MAQHAQQGNFNLNPGNADAAPAAGPHPGGGRGRGGGGNRNRNRGRGGFNRNNDPQIRPPRVNAPNPPVAGAPRPRYLSTENTPERNDPLWTTGLGGAEMYPMPNVEYSYAGCEILPQVTSVLHTAYTAASNGYARRVPESLLAYYLAVCTQYRLLSLQLANSLPLSHDEEQFVSQVSSMHLEIPMLMAHYLSGFGNTRVPSGRDIKFRMSNRPEYVTAMGVNGWYGRVTAETQSLYSRYPCLGVYMSKIMIDADPDAAIGWFPDDLVPDLPGGRGPSRALLGWGPRSRLSNQQLGYLEELGVYPNEVPLSANGSLHLSIELMMAVQGEIRQVEKMKLSPMPTSIVGSQGQLASVRYDGELVPLISHTAVITCPYRLPADISFSASAFGYRILHDVLGADVDNARPVAPWVIWRYNPVNHDDWRPFIRAGNEYRESEPEFLQIAEFRTTPYLIRSRLEDLERSLSRT